MNRDRAMRAALWIAAALNCAAAFAFALPRSLPGQLAGLPPEVPPTYRGLVAVFVLLFAGAYAWLARRPVIDRPLVALSAIGKSAAFLLAAGLWLGGATPGRTAAIFAADLVLAALFFWWLRSPPAHPLPTASWSAQD